jgi:hypothetical protein
VEKEQKLIYWAKATVNESIEIASTVHKNLNE